MYLFSKASELAMGPNQPPIQWTPGPHSLGLKQPGREVVHSSTVNNVCSYSSTHHNTFMACTGTTLLHFCYEHKRYLIHRHLTSTSLKEYNIIQR